MTQLSRRRVAPTAVTRHAGTMARAIDHEEVRRSEDRAWTFALLDEVRAPSTSERCGGQAQRPPLDRARRVDWHSRPHFTAHVFYVVRGCGPEPAAYQLGHTDPNLIIRRYGTPSQGGRSTGSSALRTGRASCRSAMPMMPRKAAAARDGQCSAGPCTNICSYTRQVSEA